jgi:hypothetical protein
MFDRKATDEDIRVNFHRKHKSLLKPEHSFSRRKFRSACLEYDVILEKIDVQGVSNWCFKSIANHGFQKMLREPSVLNDCRDQSLQLLQRIDPLVHSRVQIPTKYDTPGKLVSGYYESVLDKDGNFCFYRRLNSNDFSPKISAFELFLLKMLEHENNGIVDSEELFNSIIRNLALLIDRKRMVNPKFPLVSVKDVPSCVHNLACPWWLRV